jgi:hypothetical protein
MWFGSRSSLTRIAVQDPPDLSLQLGSDTIEPEAVVRDLTVHLDSAWSLDEATRLHDICDLVLPSASPRRARQHNASGLGPGNFQIGLLQLGSGSSTAVEDRAAATCSKCCGSFDF